MSMVPSTTAASASSTSQYTYASPTASASYFPTSFHLQQTPAPVPYICAAPPPVPSIALAPLTVYSLPQYQQAQQLFQRDAQTITLEALESVKAVLASSEIEHKAETKKTFLTNEITFL